MSLWFVLALMTAAAVFAVLWPLGRGPRTAGEGQDGGQETVVYKDQLAEVARDADAGLIAPSEAAAARVEISRRLLAAADAETQSAPPVSLSVRRGVALVALVVLPLIAVGLYAKLGSPQIGDFPVASRVTVPTANAPVESLIAQVETHLASNPADGRGWEVLAPVLYKVGRVEDSVRAWRNVITYSGETATRRADLGEAIAAAAGGIVTAEAKAELERAVALDADEVKARYLIGIAAEQDGRRDEAATIWRKMLGEAPADSPWRPLVQSALLRVGVSAPKIGDEDIAAANNMTQGDRSEMIRGMVDRLAARLKDNGDDVEGWLRLVRAYIVLGERDRAQAALSEARAATRDAGRLQMLNDGIKDLGLDG